MTSVAPQNPKVFRFFVFRLPAKPKVASMDGTERGKLNSELAAYLVDFAPRKLVDPSNSQLAKSDAFRKVYGFEWSRRAIAKVSAHKVSALVQRALRNELTKEIAKKLRTKLRRISFSAPPILSEGPREWRALLSGAGIS